MHTICACAIISHVQVQQISLFRVSCSAGNTQKLSWWRVDIFIVNNYFKFFIWHKKDKIRNCFSFLPNCWMSFLFSATEFAFIRVMLKFSSFSPVAFCSMGVRLSPTPPPPCTLCGWCINNRGCVKFLFWCVGSSLYISDIFRLSAGKRHSIKSWYTLLKLSLLISPAKHFSCLLIPQIAKFWSCWSFVISW